MSGTDLPLLGSLPLHPTADVFQASLSWQGPRAGFVFTTGEHGTGYYKDTAPPAPAAAAPAAAQPAKAASVAQPAAAVAAAKPTQANRQDSGVSAASTASPAAAAAAAAQRRASAAQQQQPQQPQKVQQKAPQQQQQQQQPARRPPLQTPKVSVAAVKPQLTAYGQEVGRDMW